MHKLTPLLLFVLLGCSDSMTPDVKVYRFYEQASLNLESRILTSGTNLVIRYSHVAAQDNNTYDDEFVENFYLEIELDENTESFNITDFEDIPHLYVRECFCGGYFSSKIEVDSQLSGEKLSNGKWAISGELNIGLYADELIQTVSLKFNQTFLKTDH